MGTLADEPPSGEVCESWLGPRGERIFFLHAKDRDDFAAYAYIADLTEFCWLDPVANDLISRRARSSGLPRSFCFAEKADVDPDH